MAMKSVTVKEFIDAIEKNGLDLTTGKLFISEDNDIYSSYPRWDANKEEFLGSPYDILDSKITSACAFGQGLINTGTIFDTYLMGLLDTDTKTFYRRVYELNDQIKEIENEFGVEISVQRFTLPEIVSQLRQEYLGREDIVLTLFAFDYTPYLEK